MLVKNPCHFVPKGSRLERMELVEPGFSGKWLSKET